MKEKGEDDEEKRGGGKEERRRQKEKKEVIRRRRIKQQTGFEPRTFLYGRSLLYLKHRQRLVVACTVIIHTVSQI